MARFLYLGENNHDKHSVVQYGPTSLIRVPLQNGKKLEIKPPHGEHFVVGEDIGVDVTDVRALRALRTDTQRFKEVSSS